MQHVTFPFPLMLMKLIKVRVCVCLTERKKQRKTERFRQTRHLFHRNIKGASSFMIASNFTVLSCHRPQMHILLKRLKFSCHLYLHRKMIYTDSVEVDLHTCHLLYLLCFLSFLENLGGKVNLHHTYIVIIQNECIM